MCCGFCVESARCLRASSQPQSSARRQQPPRSAPYAPLPLLQGTILSQLLPLSAGRGVPSDAVKLQGALCAAGVQRQ